MCRTAGQDLGRIRIRGICGTTVASAAGLLAGLGGEKGCEGGLRFLLGGERVGGGPVPGQEPPGRIVQDDADEYVGLGHDGAASAN